jgi:hypothetical protein
MNKTGLLVLIGSIVAAAFLLVIWFIGFLLHLGGGLIHLLLVLALVVGGIGTIVGVVVMLVSNKAAPR